MQFLEKRKSMFKKNVPPEQQFPTEKELNGCLAVIALLVIFALVILNFIYLSIATIQ